MSAKDILCTYIYKIKYNMKQLTFIYELLKFMLISVPLACCIYLTAHLYFEIKRICLKYL
jgi:hypothetical protein